MRNFRENSKARLRRGTYQFCGRSWDNLCVGSQNSAKTINSWIAGVRCFHEPKRLQDRPERAILGTQTLENKDEENSMNERHNDLGSLSLHVNIANFNADNRSITPVLEQILTKSKETHVDCPMNTRGTWPLNFPKARGTRSDNNFELRHDLFCIFPARFPCET